MKIVSYMCCTQLYEYSGWLFEFNPYTIGPWPVRKDGEPYKRAGKRFYEMFERWYDLPEVEREKYRVGGGCERF